MTDLRAKLQAVYQKKVEGALVDTVRVVALDASAGIVLSTPVDTGHARANWHPSVNRVDKTITDSTAVPDIIGLVTGATANIKVTDTFYLTNNLPYIRRLNNGYSKEQQPNPGFVERALLVAKNRAKRNVKTEVRG